MKETLVGIAKLVKPDSAKAFDPIDTTDLVHIYIHHVKQYTVYQRTSKYRSGK